MCARVGLVRPTRHHIVSATIERHVFIPPVSPIVNPLEGRLTIPPQREDDDVLGI